MGLEPELTHYDVVCPPQKVMGILGKIQKLGQGEHQA
jgi:hypothetical protein